jgi:hypothetical protein
MTAGVLRSASACLAVVVSLAIPSTAREHAPKRAPAARSRFFAFHNDFATNLNDALMAAGRARRDKRPELFRTGDETRCFEALPPSGRAAWDAAVEYYAKIISPGEFSARPQYLVRLDLAGRSLDANDAGAGQFVRLAGTFRSAATPAYEACRWPVQEARNRAWIDAVVARLAAHEERITARLEQLFRKKLLAPIDVDVVETVSWSGANSVFPDEGGHLLVSNAYEGLAALEVAFHEASHMFMFRGDPVRRAIDEAAKAAALAGADDLWHVALFYTTGEVVRRALEESGAAGYRPMLYGIFDRGDWSEYRSALETTWAAYVSGERPLSEAASTLIGAIARRSKDR